MRYCKYNNSIINNFTIYFFYLYTIFDEVFVFSMKGVFLVLFRGLRSVRWRAWGVVFTGELDCLLRRRCFASSEWQWGNEG